MTCESARDKLSATNLHVNILYLNYISWCYITWLIATQSKAFRLNKNHCDSCAAWMGRLIPWKKYRAWRSLGRREPAGVLMLWWHQSRRNWTLEFFHDDLKSNLLYTVQETLKCYTGKYIKPISHANLINAQCMLWRWVGWHTCTVVAIHHHPRSRNREIRTNMNASFWKGLWNHCQGFFGSIFMTRIINSPVISDKSHK